MPEGLTMAAGNFKLPLGLAILCLASVAAIGGPWAATTSHGDGSQRVYARLTEAQLDDFDDFELYWLGTEFDGLQLSGIVREVEPGTADEPIGTDLMNFLYGDCDAGGGCPFPLVVQLWPACRRNVSVYEFAGRPMPYDAVHVRGVPGASFDRLSARSRLELYTGKVTVVLFGDSPERVEKAAEGLRAIGGLAGEGTPGPGERLPAPVDGALRGKLSCDA